MKKFMPILIIGILIISGLGAAASTLKQTENPTISLRFSSPILKENRNYINIEISQANSLLLHENKPVLPSYIETIFYPLGTKINTIHCQPTLLKTISLTNYIEPTPPVVRGDLSLQYSEALAKPTTYGVGCRSSSDAVAIPNR